MTSELNAIKKIFDGYHIPLSLEWLESCLEWCKSDNLPPNYTEKQLEQMVYEQWLILDLREVEIASLPPNLSAEKKFTLTGIYYLQLMQICDISKPKLWQLQKIRNNAAKNSEPETEFGKRVLQLTLTDGIQTVMAMEFRPISCLNINLPPGTKIKIIGPLMIRNGRLMLEPRNIRNLGGSVDDLLVSNAAENVLARALGLPENSTPRQIDETILNIQREDDRINRAQVAGSSTIPWSMKQSETEKNVLCELQQGIQSCDKGRNSPELFEEMEIDDELLNEQLEKIDVESNSVPQLNDSVTFEMTKPLCTIQTPLPKLNVLPIHKLVTLLPNINKGKFKIRAKYERVVEKLSTTSGSINLVVKVTDTSGQINVEIHPTIVEKWADTTTKRLEDLRELSLQADERAKHDILLILKNIHRKMVLLDNVMEVEVVRGQKYPVVMKIFE
ncbi:hypothetical protein ABEB36_011583 [Hypothenemus hampei]|uniref:RecQ-mediated genome instability protein 1 n=1 Tax=Hypothenemus hampei TaxID=57062 RepID=A0ABD1E8D5_HYPHA